MVVDDHPGFRRLVSNLLKGEGREFLECADAESSVRDYPQFRPDLVLMDIAMQGVDGIHATKQLKASFP